MVEKKVDEELFSGDLEAELAADKGKPEAQLQQEASDVTHESVFDIALLGLVPETKEIEVVGIFQDLGSQPGLRWR